MADARTLLAQARDLFQQERFEEAGEIVGRLSADAPLDPTILNFRAYLSWKRGMAEAAAGDYRRLLQLEPDQPSHAANLGLVCFRSGLYEEALAAWARQLELRPGEPKALRGIGSCHERLGDLERALDCYQRAGDERAAERLRLALRGSGGGEDRVPGGPGPADGPAAAAIPDVERWLADAAAPGPGAGPDLAGSGTAQALVQVRGKVFVNPAYLAAHRGVLVFAPTTREAAKAAGKFGDARAALLRAEGNGELVLAGGGRRLLALRLSGGGKLWVNAPALAWCGGGVSCRFEPAGMRKGLFQAVELSGSGPFLVAVQGEPLVLAVPADLPTLARPHAVVAWTEELLWEAETVAEIRKHAGKEEALRYRFEGRGHLLLQAFA